MSNEQLHTGELQVSSATRAHHACVTEISICSHSGWHYCWYV